tara:strand:+ start:393 stop:1085 length:693 start_codon:yes stop_codon:yes gene_type:complete
MIKLKDILNESSYKSNEPIGKVMTDKDHPPFMTEEQWMEKWSGNEQKKQALIEHLGHDAVTELTSEQLDVLYEGVLDNIKQKLTTPLKRRMQKAILSFVERINFQRTKGNPGLVALQNYMRTGKITPGESAKIKKYFLKHARAYGWTAAMVATIPFSYIWIPILGEIITYAWKKWGIDAIVPTKTNNYLTKKETEEFEHMDKTDWGRKVGRKIWKIRDKHSTFTDKFGPF